MTSAKIEWTPAFTTIVSSSAVSDDDTELSQDFAITVRALDQDKSVVEGRNQHTFTVTVNNTNRPPVWSAEIPLRQLVTEGDLLEFTVAFTDPDGDEITLDGRSIVSLDERFTDNGDGTGTFSWQTDFADSRPEGYEVTFVATDALDGESGKSIRILVENVNQNPVFDAIEPITLTDGTPV